MRSLWQDLHYSARTLRNSPGFTLIAVVTLGLGMAVNTTVFSVINGVLRPLPVAHPEQLALLAMTQEGAPGFQSFSYPDFQDIRKQADGFSDVFAYHTALQGVAADGKLDVCILAMVSSNYFSALGIQPALGRFINPNEGQTPGSDPVFVLGYSYWQRRFGGDPKVIGKQVEINSRPVTIVGVAPPQFKGTFIFVEMDGYVPFSLGLATGKASVEQIWSSREERTLTLMGRLKPGVSIKQTQPALTTIAQRFAVQHPQIDKGIHIQAYPERLARPEPDPENELPTFAGAFSVLAILVLLVACFNIAGMFFVRASSRQREIGIRAALGAGRARLVRQHLMESALLAIFGGAAGLLLANWAAGFLSALPLGADFFITLDFEPDARVYAVALAAVFVSALLVGVLPALRVARGDLNAVLREGGRGAVGAPGRSAIRKILVGAQLAGCLLLLVVAGLFVRTLDKARRMDLGFNPDHLLNVSVRPAKTEFDEKQSNEFYRQLEARIAALPGVVSVTQAFFVPLGALTADEKVTIEGRPAEAGKQPPQIMYNTVTPSYFKTLQIRIESGRGFTDADNEKAPPVAVINQAMAAKFWPRENPLGKRFSINGEKGPFIEVIGITPTGQYEELFEDPKPFFFIPMAQQYKGLRNIQVRTSTPPETLKGAIEAQVRDLARDSAIPKAQTMMEAMQGVNGFFFYQFGAQLTGVMALLGLVLAIVGVYSMAAYTASQRTHEIGIRMALGAEPRDILNMVLRQSLVTVAVGVSVGLAAALAATQAISSLIVGVGATDPLTFISVVLLLSIISLIACWIPARRATRVDPLIALRHE
jgi:macrolide transport system ATP-binding/permease protein